MGRSNRRPLTEEEKAVELKQIERLEKRNDWLKFQVKYYDLMLAEGLEQNYLKTVREYKEQRKEFDSELKENERIVKGLNEQIKDGVEIKGVEEVKPVEQEEDESQGERKYIG